MDSAIFMIWKSGGFVLLLVFLFAVSNILTIIRTMNNLLISYVLGPAPLWYFFICIGYVRVVGEK